MPSPGAAPTLRPSTVHASCTDPAVGSPQRHKTSPEPEGLAGTRLASALPRSQGALTLGVRKVAKPAAGMFMVEPPKLSPGYVLQAMWASLSSAPGERLLITQAVGRSGLRWRGCWGGGRSPRMGQSLGDGL